MKTLAIVGNSICAGAYATSARFTIHALLMERLRSTGEEWCLLTQPHDSLPRIGHVYQLWRRIRAARPDVLCIAGFGENDYSSSVSSVAAAISIDAPTITFNAAPVEGRCYILTDGTDEELVIPLFTSGNTAYGCWRGACGTRQRAWPAGTTVLSWPDNNNRPALRKQMYYVLRQIARECRGVILVGVGDAFAGMNAGHGPTLQAVVQQLIQEGFTSLEPVPFVDSRGNELFQPATQTAYTGPTDYLASALDSSATTMTVTNGDRINVGDYLVLSSDSGVPTHANSEIVKVTGRASQTALTIARAQLGSTARSFSMLNRVMRISQAYMNPRAPWANVGSSGMWSWLGMSHDRHPWDTGYLQLADRFFEAYLRRFGIHPGEA